VWIDNSWFWCFFFSWFENLISSWLVVACQPNKALKLAAKPSRRFGAEFRSASLSHQNLLRFGGNLRRR